LRFRPLRRLPGGGQPLLPGVPALGSVASSAFLTLSRPCSARHLPALFHAGAALGVLPFRVDPTRRAECPLGHPCPLVVEPERCAFRASRCEPTAWGQFAPVRGGVDRKTPSRPALHFRALIPASVRTRRWRFRPADGPRPSWGSSSLGGSPSPPEANPGPILSRASQRPRTLEPLLPPRVLLAKRLAGLPRVCHPFRGSLTLSTNPDLRGETSKSLYVPRCVVQAHHNADHRTHPPLPELTGIGVSVTTLYETTQPAQT
jgi:hypothetical protein